MISLSKIVYGVAVLLGFEETAAVPVPSTTQEIKPMANETQTAAAPAAPQDTDTVLDNVKKVLTTAGHDVENVWAEVVALAKKL